LKYLNINKRLNFKNKYSNLYFYYSNLNVINSIFNSKLEIKLYFKQQNQKKQIKVLGYLLKTGNFSLNAINSFNVFSRIYKLLFINNSTLLTLNYKYTKEFLYNFFKYTNYNNFFFILNWILNWVKPMFFMDCVVVPKKYRKKLKKKYLYKIKYLSHSTRLNKSLKLIKNYKNSLKYYSNFNRELFCYLDLILNYKYSYIYLKKIDVYKKVFQI